MPKRLNPFSALADVYYNWKSLQLPWRKQFYAGRDLQGNTYWEFRDIRSGSGGQGRGTRAAPDPSIPGHRMRRIVQYPKGTHPGEVRVPPQWHQWLRHVRAAAPTVAEQEAEVARQHQMRLLAARADARWAGAQRVEGPIEPAAQLMEAAAPNTATPATEAPQAPQAQPVAEASPQAAKDPWKEAARGNPGQTWEPAAWTPPPAVAKQR